MTDQQTTAGRALAALSAGRAEEGAPDLTIKSDDPIANLRVPLHTAPVENPSGSQAMPQTQTQSAGTTTFEGAITKLETNAAPPPVDYAARQALGITETPPGAEQPSVPASGVEQSIPATPASQPVQNSRILVDFSDPNVVFQTKDGRQLTGKEVEGEMLMKQNYSRKEWDLLQQKKVVDAQSHILTIAGKSKFAATLLQALAAGADEDAAIRGALTVAGKEPVAPQAQPPEYPAEDDPEFFKKFAAYNRWVMEDVIDKRMPAQVQQPQIQRGLTQDQMANAEYNQEILGAYIMPFMPKNMTPAQNEYVSNLIRLVAEEEEIPINVADNRLSKSDVKIIQQRLFPGSQVPAVIQAELARLGQPQGYVPPPVAGYAPAPIAGPAPNGQMQNTISLQAFVEQQKELRELKEKLGLAPPGVPHQPVAQAGGPSVALPQEQSAWSATPTKERIRDALAAIPRQ